MGARENKVERYLNSEVERIGGLTRKWVSPGNDGVPDRLVFFNGEVWLVEVKTTDGRRSPTQIREHNRLKKVGVDVLTLYGHTDVDDFIRSLL